jgi:hypothetical protein
VSRVFHNQLKREYKDTWELFKEARAAGNHEEARRFSSDLIRIADAMERSQDD